MQEIKIRFNYKEEAMIIADLSKRFAEENSCNGVVAENQDFFENLKVVVAVAEGEIIGYCYGNIEKEERNRSFAKRNDLFFYLEEIYVIPEYRKDGVGQKLFNFIENYAKKEGCKTLRLSAVSKDYKRLLSFYIDKLNMTFWSAYLIKNIEGDKND